MGARYLVRFDDLCPTMNWRAWEGIERVLEDLSVRPVLAVVPDNVDPKLHIDPPRPDFWARVRRWAASGWTIAIHGYQHRYVNQNSGMLRLNRYSEFAGLGREEQEDKLRKALAIFTREGVDPEVWIAPAHSFDEVTLDVLKEIGVKIVSDGFSIYPRYDARGMLWIPQQLWRFRRMPAGVWTVCLHHNRWDAARVERFREELTRYRPQLTNVSDISERYAERRSGGVAALNRLLEPVLAYAARARAGKRQKPDG